MVENRFHKRAEVKKRKSVKTNNAPSFLLYFSCSGGSKINEKTLKNSIENESEFKCGFEVDFLTIFLDFRSTLGPKMEPTFEKEGMKKHDDFQTKLEGRMTAIEPSSSSRDCSLGTTTMTRPIGLNNIIWSRSMFGI